MLVRQFMTQPVFAFEPATECRAALAAMRERRIRRAPVVEHGRIVGMVSERDLLRILPGTVVQLGTRAGADAGMLPVSDVMSRDLVTLDPDQHLEDAARLMLERKIGGVPVVSDGACVGIITESDVFRAFVRISEKRGLLRVSLSRGASTASSADPVRIAVELGFEVRGVLACERQGGDELVVLRLRGDARERLVERLGAAGFVVLEIEDARGANDRRPAG